jgi:hypothetical protein
MKNDTRFSRLPFTKVKGHTDERARSVTLCVRFLICYNYNFKRKNKKENSLYILVKSEGF